MSLSDKKVVGLLNEKFACAWKDISKDPSAGRSLQHDKDFQAADVNNGSGFHNVRIFVLTPDGRVVHCLPGYWKPDALATELEFALELVNVWQDSALSRRAKADRFMDAHLTHMKRHSEEMVKQSDLPRFDQSVEKYKGRDTCRSDGSVKKTDQIVHERMAERPFLPMADFDVAKFADVGEEFYDAHTDGCRRK